MSTLIVVPCGAAKIWDRVPNSLITKAEEVYTSAYFKVNRRYARLFGDRWVILSAKYGFIAPDFEIPAPYEETFKKPDSGCVSMEVLKTQAHALVKDHKILHVVALGGRDYIDRVMDAFRHTGVIGTAPFYGLTMLKQMKAIRQSCEEREGVSSASGR